MGVAQNSINQAIGLGLGLAGTAVHLGNQAKAIEQQKEGEALTLEGNIANISSDIKKSENEESLNKANIKQMNKNIKGTKAEIGRIESENMGRRGAMYDEPLISDEKEREELKQLRHDKRQLMKANKDLIANREALMVQRQIWQGKLEMLRGGSK